MPSTTTGNPGSATRKFADVCHPACIACRARDAGGLGLHFASAGDGRVQTEFACDPHYQGYPDRIHGGFVTLLLDAAMTHCLFARQVRAYTAKLSVRFRRPVVLSGVAQVDAWCVENRAPVYVMRSELRQGSAVCATAEALFWADDTPVEASQTPAP